MLDTAERWLKQILAGLRDEIRSGTPMIVLEPSCCAVFRDELTGLFPHDQDATRLKNQTFLLSEFLRHNAPHYPSEQLDRKALVHLHCHHRAIMKTEAEQELLERAGVHFDVPEQGCCGMAGAFGFEKGDPYDVSIKCGERKLLPSVREAGEGTLIIADGFSCHQQIVEQTSRQPLHLAEVLQMAKQFGRIPPPAREPKPAGIQPSPMDEKHEAAGLALGAGAILAGVGAYLLARKRRDAMTSVFSPFKDMSAEEFRHVTEVTYLGVVHGTMRRWNAGLAVSSGSTSSAAG